MSLRETCIVLQLKQMSPLMQNISFYHLKLHNIYLHIYIIYTYIRSLDLVNDIMIDKRYKNKRAKWNEMKLYFQILQHNKWPSSVSILLQM